MSKVYKVFAPEDLKLTAVEYMKVSDNCADVFLRKNIRTELTHEASENTDEQLMNVADELYFQVDASTVSKEDIEKHFDKYWIYGEHWRDERDMTESEKINELIAKNAELNQCILALCNMM